MALTHGTRSDPAPDGVSQGRPRGGDAVVGELIDVSHRLHPDEIPTVVARIVCELPAAEAAVYVVDYDQRVLVPLVTDGPPPLDIDASLAGRAFQREIVLAEPTEGGTRLWVPLVNGANRLGVLSAVVPDDGDVVRTHLRRFAGVVAHLLVSKSVYGDALQLARRRREMDLASELLWSMLPPLTFSHSQVGIAGILEPAHSVAGDCFDYALNGGLAHIAILDAMGHGLEASRIATLALAAYRNSRRGRRRLPEIFRTIDEAVVDQFGDERFVTGQLGELNVESGRLSWLNAGHPRPLVLRGGTHVVEVGGTPSLPLGLGDVPSELAEVDLEPGDQVLFFTDGVVEARSDDGELFGRHRLGDLLVKSGADALPIAETVRRLCHAALAWGGPDIRDDATLVLLEWRGPRASRHLSWGPTSGGAASDGA